MHTLNALTSPVNQYTYSLAPSKTYSRSSAFEDQIQPMSELNYIFGE